MSKTMKLLCKHKLIANCATALTLCCAAMVEASEFRVTFADVSWNGVTVPAGQECKKDGGNGSTPPLEVSGIPAGTVAILLAINDKDARYRPMRSDGGHGIIGFEHAGGEKAMLVVVPGGTKKDLPPGTWIERKNRAKGAWQSAGYLPPCSGGKGNLYVAEVSAVDGSGKELAQATVELGKY